MGSPKAAHRLLEKTYWGMQLGCVVVFTVPVELAAGVLGYVVFGVVAGEVAVVVLPMLLPAIVPEVLAAAGTVPGGQFVAGVTPGVVLMLLVFTLPGAVVEVVPGVVPTVPGVIPTCPGEAPGLSVPGALGVVDMPVVPVFAPGSVVVVAPGVVVCAPGVAVAAPGVAVVVAPGVPACPGSMSPAVFAPAAVWATNIPTPMTRTAAAWNSRVRVRMRPPSSYLGVTK